MGGMRNLKSALRPETIGADKDFKDLRAFKDFSDGWGPARVVEVFYGGVYGDVGAMGAKEMMGAPGAMWKCR